MQPFVLNFSGVKPITGPLAADPLSGYYQGQITKIATYVASSGADRVQVTATFEGATRSHFFGVPNPNEPNSTSMRFWAALFLSAGYQEAAIQNGNISISSEADLINLLVGRSCTVHYTQAPEPVDGQKSYGKLVFLPQDAWAKGKAEAEGVAQAAAAPAGSSLGGIGGGNAAPVNPLVSNAMGANTVASSLTGTQHGAANGMGTTTAPAGNALPGGNPLALLQQMTGVS